MLLCLSSRLERAQLRSVPRQGCKHFPGDIALKAADDLPLAEALGPPSRVGRAGRGMVAQPDERDYVERAVGCPIGAATQAVAAAGPAAAGGLRSCPTELGEGSLAANAVGVVAGGDQELAGDLGADTEEISEFGCRAELHQLIPKR